MVDPSKGKLKTNSELLSAAEKTAAGRSQPGLRGIAQFLLTIKLGIISNCTESHTLEVEVKLYSMEHWLRPILPKHNKRDKKHALFNMICLGSI